jgi:hypothetical protein
MNPNQMDLLGRQLNEQLARALMPYLFIALFFGFIWLMALINAITSDFKNPSNKIIWIILLILIAPIGTVLYYLISPFQKEEIQPNINNDYHFNESKIEWDDNYMASSKSKWEKIDTGKKEKWF